MSQSPNAAAAPLPIDRLTVASMSDQRTFNRGRALQRKGQVTGATVRGNRLEATCRDGQYTYGVSVVLPTHAEAGLVRVPASCDCRQFYGQCPHIVALLLAWIEHPESFAVLPTITVQLAGMSREALAAIIERMVELAPDLERVIALPGPDPGRGSPNVPSIDPAVVAAEVRNAMHQHAMAIPAFGDLFPQLDDPGIIDDLLALSREYGDAGRWADVQVILTALADGAIAQSWHARDDDDVLANVIAQCDTGLSACLAIQASLPAGDRLDAHQREHLLRALYSFWRFDAYDLAGLGIAPAGREMIVSHATTAERSMVERWLADEKGAGAYAREATTDFQVALREVAGEGPARLLAIYREAGRWDEVATRLLSQERVDDAIATAREHLKEPDLLTDFASQLAAHAPGRVTDAVKLVEDHAWEVQGKNPQTDDVFTQWLAVYYARAGRGEEALAMADQQFRHDPGLETWRAVRVIASQPGQPADAWESRRPAMAARLRELDMLPFLFFAEIEEGHTDAAQGLLDELRMLHGRDPFHITIWDIQTFDRILAETIERVNPDQAIARFRSEADAQIGRRTRDAYQVAANYLERVKGILAGQGREADWQEVIDDIRARHPRLRALHEELDALDLA